MNTIKGILWGLLVGFLFGLMTCKNCTKSCESRVLEVVKTVHDTIKVPVPAQIAEIPKPTQVKETKPQIDSFIQYEYVVDSALIRKYNFLAERYNILLTDLTTKREYEDSAKFEVGTVVGHASVSQNRLQDWKFSLRDAHQTVITNTTTNTVAERHTIGFFGLGGGYQFDSTLYLSLAFRVKFKNDALLGVSGKINTHSQKMAELEYAVPIRLGKRK